MEAMVRKTHPTSFYVVLVLFLSTIRPYQFTSHCLLISPRSRCVPRREGDTSHPLPLSLSRCQNALCTRWLQIQDVPLVLVLMTLNVVSQAFQLLFILAQTCNCSFAEKGAESPLRTAELRSHMRRICW